MRTKLEDLKNLEAHVDEITNQNKKLSFEIFSERLSENQTGLKTF